MMHFRPSSYLDVIYKYTFVIAITSSITNPKSETVRRLVRLNNDIVNQKQGTVNTASWRQRCLQEAVIAARLSFSNFALTAIAEKKLRSNAHHQVAVG